MPRLLFLLLLASAVVLQSAHGQPAAPAAAARSASPQKKAPPAPPPIRATAAELARIEATTVQIEALVAELRTAGADADLLGDVAVYAHAGRMLLANPDMFANQGAVTRAFTTLEQGLERGRQLRERRPQWTQGRRRIHAYASAIDGAVLPYGVILPADYDPSRPARLYVWLHGRQNTNTETEFIHGFLNRNGTGNPPVAEQGQIQLECFGRVNGAGWHWAGERDVFESIAAVQRRFNIDDRRIILRGFSMGGEGAWHIALHHPDRFAAAEIGAGTVSRTAEQQPELLPFQRATLRIWENISEWALNIHNLPLAGHDGETDLGQLESSLRARAQLEREGYPSVGEPDFLRSQGAPGLWMVSKATGHGTSPLVRERLDAFLREHGDRGITSPDHIRFVTYTTRYNRSHWVSVDGLGRHYERADVDARRSSDGATYAIITHNVTRLVLRETARARTLTIDGQAVPVAGAPELTLVREGETWKSASVGAPGGLRKTHALQGPIEDAFLDPFLLVRPTGVPWNDAVNRQALRTLERFERMWVRYFRGRPFIKDDREVTPADLARFHLVLFGDPGSNAWLAKLNGRLPYIWTKDGVTLGNRTLPAGDHYPALIYPNPLQPDKYVVVNTGLTFEDRGYNGDYGTPRWGDYALVRVTADAPLPELVAGGLFDEQWRWAK